MRNLIPILFMYIVMFFLAIAITTPSSSTSCASMDSLAQYEDEIMAIIDILIKQEEERDVAMAKGGNETVMFQMTPSRSRLEQLRILKQKILKRRNAE